MRAPNIRGNTSPPPQLLAPTEELNEECGADEASVAVITSAAAAATTASRSIGFVADRNRSNVALSRAKEFCFIVGHAESLSADPCWQRLVEFSKQTALTVFEAGVGYEALPP